MVNEGERRVAWWGGSQVKFLGLGHTLRVGGVVVDCAVWELVRDRRRRSDNVDWSSSIMVVWVLLP